MSRITSPFGRESTAAEVAAGHDLSGRRAIVTGASSGLGIETARVLAGCGAEVVLAVRDVAAAAPAVARIAAAGGRAYAAPLDLADLRSVAAFAEREGGQPLHLLIANAGVMACPELRTAQGFEMQLGVNHLGHFLLTTRLLPALAAAQGARVVVLSSRGHQFAAFDFDDPSFERTPYDPLIAYGRSKTANALFALELDRRHADRGIRAFSLMPGAIQTALGRHMTPGLRARLAPPPGAAAGLFLKSVEQGSATTIWAALAPELEGRGGLYLEDCAEAEPAREGVRGGVQPWAQDPVAAARLWDWSERAVADTGMEVAA